MFRSRLVPCAYLAAGHLLAAAATFAADQPQWGERHSRNMVSAEAGLPESFDLETGRGVRWSVPLGRGAYGTPSVGGGWVLVGADNAEPRDPRHVGDRAVLLCLDEATGKLQWQLVVPRIGGDVYLDWPNISLCSTPTIDGDVAYTLTNRFEVVCLDLKGLADGNDGPYQDEGRHMTPADQPPLEPSPLDADILWLTDLRTAVGMYPHDSAHSSILLDGGYLYLNSCNGVDNTHRKIRAPDAPSLVVLDKRTGRVVAQDGERIGPRIFHSTWSSPAMGVVGGQSRVFFCGGDGICYGFAPLPPVGGSGDVQTLERVWRCDPDPSSPKEDVHQYNRNREVSPSNVKSMPVLVGDRLYVTLGGDIWWGKKQAWLKCIDASGTGDVTGRGEIWSFDLEQHCCATPAVFRGMVFVADCGGNVYCVDAATGQQHWSHRLRREIWASTLVADGKVYVGSRGGDFCILAADREKRVLAEADFGSPIASTPVAANGVLYVATLQTLYALQQE